jgi:SanA protein
MRRKTRVGKKMRLFLFFTGIVIVLVIAALFLSTWVINKKTEGYLTNDIRTTPINRVGLVLGTSKYLSAGRLNLFFQYRIDATVDLYNSGKIEYILVSGDNHWVNYNEPDMMRKELIKRGIPSNKIYMDFAGFRTFDSMIRCHEVFGQTSFTVISQKFHNQRAVYIARHLGLEVVGFNARDVELSESFKTLIRECFARVKVFVDIYTNTKPKFLGEKIVIGQ